MPGVVVHGRHGQGFLEGGGGAGAVAGEGSPQAAAGLPGRPAPGADRAPSALASGRPLHRLGLVVVVVAAAGLRLWGLGRFGFRGDEAVYSGQAAVLAGLPDFDRHFVLVSRGNSNFLMVQSLLAVVYGIFGVHDMLGRALAATFSVLTVVLTYRLARILYDRRSALWAALFLTLSGYSLLLGRLALLDSTFTFLFVLSVYCVVRWDQGRQARWLCMAGAAASLAIQAKVVGLLLVPIFGAFVLARRGRALPGPRQLLACGATFLAFLVPLAVQVALHGQTLLSLLAGSSQRRSAVPWHYYADVVLRHEGPLVLALWGSGLVLALLRRSRGDLVPLVWLVVVVGFFSAYPLKGYNYLLPAVPALAMMAGRAVAGGLARFPAGGARPWLAGAAVAAAAVVASAPSLGRAMHDDDAAGLEVAARWLRDNTPPRAGVMTPSNGSAQMALAFYSGRDSYPFGRFQLSNVLPGGVVVPPGPSENGTPRDWVTFWPSRLIESGTVTHLVLPTSSAYDDGSDGSSFVTSSKERLFRELIARHGGDLVHTARVDGVPRAWIYRVTRPAANPSLRAEVAGGAVTVSADHFRPRSAVRFYYYGRPVAAGLTDDNGSATATFVLPAGARERFRLVATDAEGSSASLTGLSGLGASTGAPGPAQGEVSAGDGHLVPPGP